MDDVDDIGLDMFSLENNMMTTGDMHGFQPTHIIYRKLSHDPAIGYVYTETPKRRKIDRLPAALRTIEAFAAFVASNSLTWEKEMIKEQKTLGIPGQRHAYVVIQIDASAPYFFNGQYPGISLGRFERTRAHADLHYRNVRHLDPSDGVLKTAPCANCRVAVFSFVPPTSNSEQLLNFNFVDLGGTPVIVDPDIRYPGTGGGIDGEGTP